MVDLILYLSSPKSIIDSSQSANSLVAQACGRRSGQDETFCLINLVEKLQKILQENFFEADSQLLALLEFYLHSFLSKDRLAHHLSFQHSVIASSYPGDSLVARACSGRTGSDETICLIEVVENLEQLLQETFSETESQINYLNSEVEYTSESVDFALMQYQSCLITLGEEKTAAEDLAGTEQIVAITIFLIFSAFIVSMFCAWKLGQVSAQRCNESHQSVHQYPHILRSVESI